MCWKGKVLETWKYKKALGLPVEDTSGCYGSVSFKERKKDEENCIVDRFLALWDSRWLLGSYKGQSLNNEDKMKE